MEKSAIREQVWDEMADAGVARFPFPPHGRIPNFAGADTAADRLTELAVWDAAGTLKANPDAPQLPVRRRALRAGRVVYMAVPRLSDRACFMELDPANIDDIDSAATVSAMADYGRQVGPDGVNEIDLIVVGSVAVTPDGARVGKGEGYSDLEFAILREAWLVDGTTPVVTTVHDIQVVESEIPVSAHDVPIDVIVTPSRVVRTQTPFARPAGIDWSAVSPTRRQEIPILADLAPDQQ